MRIAEGYDWRTMKDGEVHVAVRNRDYTCMPCSFRNQLRQHGVFHAGRFKTRTIKVPNVPNGDVFTYQWIPK